jgi:hypothetical protein
MVSDKDPECGLRHRAGMPAEMIIIMEEGIIYGI